MHTFLYDSQCLTYPQTFRMSTSSCSYTLGVSWVNPVRFPINVHPIWFRNGVATYQGTSRESSGSALQLRTTLTYLDGSHRRTASHWSYPSIFQGYSDNATMRCGYLWVMRTISYHIVFNPTGLERRCNCLYMHSIFIFVIYSSA